LKTEGTSRQYYKDAQTWEQEMDGAMQYAYKNETCIGSLVWKTGDKKLMCCLTGRPHVTVGG